MDNQTQQTHDHLMASEPFGYRGYLIRPISHKVQPHWISETRSFAYWGWSVFNVDGAGVSPGATWGHSPMQAMDIVDCMIEAQESGQDFWALMHRKAALSRPQDYLLEATASERRR